MNWLIIFYCINLLYCVTSVELKDKNKENSEDVFIPTNEWQVVKKGQPIPKGLHVRINLETRLTEAKLLEDDLKDEKKNALLTVDQPDTEEGPNNAEISKEKITDALKNIKNEDLTPDDEEDIKRVTNKFKKYEEIKKELEHINLTPKSDAELLRELLKRYKDLNSNKKLDIAVKNVETYNILEDIEYLVHQIDNANEFISLKGFETTIYNNFNSSNAKIKCQVLNILGSSVQNNPKAQIHALETGCIDKLSRLLALETNNDVLSRTIYAISSLLRRFPLAQQQFIKSGGLSVFTEIFEKSELKLQVRLVTLLYDLITEHNNAIKHTENSDYALKVQQYNNVNLKTRLSEFKWCNIFSNVLKYVLSTDENDHDSIEKCLNVINTCLLSFNTTDVRNMFYKLNNKYTTLAEKESKENAMEKDVANHIFYFKKMKEITDNLIHNLNTKTEL